jgi:hypothetical protein
LFHIFLEQFFVLPGNGSRAILADMVDKALIVFRVDRLDQELFEFLFDQLNFNVGDLVPVVLLGKKIDNISLIQVILDQVVSKFADKVPRTFSRVQVVVLEFVISIYQVKK